MQVSDRCWLKEKKGWQGWISFEVVKYKKNIAKSHIQVCVHCLVLLFGLAVHWGSSCDSLNKRLKILFSPYFLHYLSIIIAYILRRSAATTQLRLVEQQCKKDKRSLVGYRSGNAMKVLNDDGPIMLIEWEWVFNWKKQACKRAQLWCTAHSYLEWSQQLVLFTIYNSIQLCKAQPYMTTTASHPTPPTKPWSNRHKQHHFNRHPPSSIRQLQPLPRCSHNSTLTSSFAHLSLLLRSTFLPASLSLLFPLNFNKMSQKHSRQIKYRTNK